MANIIRLAKSGSDWSAYELVAYNITVQRQDADLFFGRKLHAGSIDHLDPNLLSSADPTIATDLSKDTYRFLAHLALASHASHEQENSIVDFAKSVLQVTGFDEVGTILRTRYDIPLTVCGDSSGMEQADLCLIHLNSMILLVVQNNKSICNPSNPEPQIIAEAVATFQYNNQKRADLDLPVLDKMMVPCITLVGTRPFFYLVPVTEELSKCVALGQYPSQPTIVRCCAPPRRRRAFEGMEAPDYRRTALQYYDAFHSLAKSHWTMILDGYH